jgi:hypothetical protein
MGTTASGPTQAPSITWYDSPDKSDRRRALTLEGGRLYFTARQEPFDVWPPPVQLELPRDGVATEELAWRLADILEVPVREPAPQEELRRLTQADLTAWAVREAEALRAAAPLGPEGRES